MEEYTKEYMHFLNHSKTERECADTVVNLVEKEGFTDLAALVRDKKKLKAGDKVYATWMNKAVILCRIGEKPMEEGMNIVASHIDSPRLDIKPNPLYENTGVAYLDTHYYGGIKKYQWVTLPLAIHGVVVKKDGITEEICIGEDKDDLYYLHLSGYLFFSYSSSFPSYSFSFLKEMLYTKLITRMITIPARIWIIATALARPNWVLGLVMASSRIM